MTALSYTRRPTLRRPTDNGTYVPSVVVPLATGVVATDWANILAAVNKAQALVAQAASPGGVGSGTGGRAQVLFQGCPVVNGVVTPYAIGPNWIPIYDDIEYIGQAPHVRAINATNTPSSFLPDGDWNYYGGTVIKGDGSAPGMWDGQTDQASPPTDLGDTGVNNVRIYGFGFDTVTYGVKTGARNMMGMMRGEFSQVYVKNASQWGVFFANFQHVDFGHIHTCLTGSATAAPADAAIGVGGQYYANLFTGANSPGPGNSRWRGELFHKSPITGSAGFTGNQNLVRGIVFDTQGDGAHTSNLGSIDAGHVQVNSYSRTHQSDSVTLTSGQSTIAVPDGTQYAPYLPVAFTTTGNGFTVGVIYFVKTVSGNNITLASSRSGAAIVASGSATMTLQNYGMAGVEAGATTASAILSEFRMSWCDVEGTAGVGLLLDHVSTGECRNVTVPPTNLTGVCFRSASYLLVHAPNSTGGVPTDFDTSSVACFWQGVQGTSAAYPARSVPGFYYNIQDSAVVLQLSNANQQHGDIQARASGMLYPSNQGVGIHYVGYNTSVNIPNGFSGAATYTGGAGNTLTLPTINVDTTPNNTCAGACIEIWNVSANAVTVATDGTQLFNKVAALTSLSVAAQTIVRLRALKDAGNVLYWAAESQAIRTS